MSANFTDDKLEDALKFAKKASRMNKSKILIYKKHYGEVNDSEMEIIAECKDGVEKME